MKKCIYVISIILFFLIIYTAMPYIVNFFADLSSTYKCNFLGADNKQ